MIFRQLFDSVSGTYTYLLACRDTGQAVLIDPVVETVERDLSVLQSLGLNPPYPKKIDVAVPANKLCGDCPTDLPERLRQIGGKSEQG